MKEMQEILDCRLIQNYHLTVTEQMVSYVKGWDKRAIEVQALLLPLAGYKELMRKKENPPHPPTPAEKELFKALISSRLMDPYQTTNPRSPIITKMAGVFDALRTSVVEARKRMELILEEEGIYREAAGVTGRVCR